MKIITQFLYETFFILLVFLAISFTFSLTATTGIFILSFLLGNNFHFFAFLVAFSWAVFRLCSIALFLYYLFFFARLISTARRWMVFSFTRFVAFYLGCKKYDQFTFFEWTPLEYRMKYQEYLREKMDEAKNAR